MGGICSSNTVKEGATTIEERPTIRAVKEWVESVRDRHGAANEGEKVVVLFATHAVAADAIKNSGYTATRGLKLVLADHIASGLTEHVDPADAQLNTIIQLDTWLKVAERLYRKKGAIDLRRGGVNVVLLRVPRGMLSEV
eukprot:CAMPEP_0169466050 /NCGR_PEP_ID=MMETSP1042-20121227/21557_1 /TAXON_ID=464988 /ORGANISM="Hemiselmis andersenii, Strain CCMP1180" /LENGTH=139 /DNA_ID=CAMNT_0009579069 /DNA_START=31 /DNA_END=446 /DNA_ORIENTATION=-